MISRFLAVGVAAAVLIAPMLRAEDAKPTRAAFLAEVLDPKPTAVTPKFDDYTPGSYHVAKEDLLNGLVEEAKQRKLTLRAVSIAGPLPFDPLWTSYILVVIQEGDKLRVNSLVMPHARITGKATGLLTADEYKKWLEGIQNVGLLQKEAVDAKEKASPDKSEIVLVTWSKDGKTRELLLGNTGKDDKTQKLFEQFNVAIKKLKKTYPEAGE